MRHCAFTIEEKETSKAHHTKWMSETPVEIQYNFAQIMNNKVSPECVDLQETQIHPKKECTKLIYYVIKDTLGKIQAFIE